MARTKAEAEKAAMYPHQGAFNWKDFGKNGKASHLFTAGIMNAGLDSKMLLPEGYQKETEHFGKEVRYAVVYDKEFVLEKLAQQLEKLEIISGGKVDKALLKWLIAELTTYIDSYAERENEKMLVEQATQLSEQFPGVGDIDHWIGVLKAQLELKNANKGLAVPSAKSEGSKKQE